MVDIFSGRADIVGEALDNASGIFAHVGQSLLTEGAAATAPIRIYGHPVAGAKVRYLLAHRVYNAGNLVPQGNGQLQGTGAALSLVFVKIGAAESAVGHGDPHGIRSQLRIRKCTDVNLVTAG